MARLKEVEAAQQREHRRPKAEKMYLRALTGYEKGWGPGHTLTLNTINNSGNLYIAVTATIGQITEGTHHGRPEEAMKRETEARLSTMRMLCLQGFHQSLPLSLSPGRDLAVEVRRKSNSSCSFLKSEEELWGRGYPQPDGPDLPSLF